MRTHVGVLLPCALVLLGGGCNQLLGIEQSEVASDTELGVSCESNAQCQSDQQCVEGHCRPAGGGPRSPP